MPTLLIADDSMFQRFMLSKTAQEKGFTVLEASNGQECLDMALENDPDGLLLDLNMPGLTGLEVLQSIHENGRKFKILVITADIQETTKERCLTYGATGFLNKPVDEQALAQALDSLFE